MKHFSLILHFLVAYIAGVKAQNNNPQRQYRADATQLAGRLAATMGESATISSRQIDAYEKALVSVSLSDLPQAKTVINAYQIHAFQRVNLTEINVYADPKTPWILELEKGEKISNVLIAGIITDYQLSGVLLSKDEGLASVRFTTQNPMNVRFIAQQLSMSEDIFLSEVPTSAEDGNDIQIKEVKGGWMVTYSLRFNNCHIGCQNEHSWQFGVKENGDVCFVTEYGDEPPYQSEGANVEMNLVEKEEGINKIKDN